MMASPTATNHAMLFSSGPKVTARGCCQPTNYLLHLKQNVVIVWALAAHAMRVTQESFHHNVCLQHSSFFSPYRKCFATSPAHATYLLLPSLLTPHTHCSPCGSSRREHWWCGQLHLWQGAQCSDPALNLCPLRLIPLLYTTLTINHSIICSLFFFFSPPVHSYLRQPAFCSRSFSPFILTRFQQI